MISWRGWGWIGAALWFVTLLVSKGVTDRMPFDEGAALGVAFFMTSGAVNFFLGIYLETRPHGSQDHELMGVSMSSWSLTFVVTAILIATAGLSRHMSGWLGFLLSVLALGVAPIAALFLVTRAILVRKRR